MDVIYFTEEYLQEKHHYSVYILKPRREKNR